MNLQDNKDTIGDTFTDFALTIISVFSVLMFLLLLIVNPKAIPDVNVKKNANYIIEMEWPEDIDCDVDLWVLGPNGDYVSFANKSTQLMHIERDDMGVTSDTLSTLINGEPSRTKENREIWTLRGVWDGIFTANIHLYSCHSITMKPGSLKTIPVTLRVIQINPQYVIKYVAKKELDKVWQEKTMVTFELKDNNRTFYYRGDEFRGVVKTARGETLR